MNKNESFRDVCLRESRIPADQEFFDTVTHHGREYQKYSIDNGVYFCPIDEDEMDRLEAMHSVFCRVFDNRLIFPPIRNPRRILDCGFGAGNWAIDVAERYPNCEVTGIDVSPHMIPEDIPDNFDPQIDDLNGRFTFPSNHFDLVHSQMMAGGIHSNRWRSYLADIFRVTRPGGWCQMVEIYFNAQSDNGTLTNDHALRRWSRRYLRGVQPYKDPRSPLQMEAMLRSAGFVDIEARVLTLPIHALSKARELTFTDGFVDERERNIGLANRENIHRLLSSMAVYPFTEFLGMSIAEVQILVAQARSEASNPAFKVRVYRQKAQEMNIA
ncbi:hypothetical protein jhhlp_003510 [Lomentospora prolificans]|uniref:Methyltransferase domain-containing protein n=1 Tax=Lomentospora prolificans TaxID=41688 RepID=A0A2N3N920_9PEZI|nr:hypothetical protein jhhlp_003510 [Lomentospora prolificans]